MKRVDPTRTVLIRRKFKSELKNRFNNLNDAVEQYFETLYDLVTIRDNSVVVGHFKSYLQQSIEKFIEGNWYQRYLELSYKQGLDKAFNYSKPAYLLTTSEGISQGFRMTFLNLAHDSKNLSQIFLMTKEYLVNDLNNFVTQVMGDFTRGLVSSLSKTKILQDLNKHINTAFKRAVSIANTEVVRANAYGTLDGLKQLKVREVTVVPELQETLTANENVEYSTAGDSRVCPLCRPFDKVIIPLQEAYSLIPIHTNCRCSFSPITTPADYLRFDEALEEFSELADL